MPTSYTNITKPSATTYLTINEVGREQYDQNEHTYDDSTMFYDGVNQSFYTNIAKPSATTYTNLAKP